MTDQPGPDLAAVFDALPTPYLVLTPDFTVVAVNRAYEQVTGTPRARVVGQAIFEAFPDDTDPDTAASGAAQLRASFERVLRTRQPDAMSLLRYAVADADGTYTTQWWSPLNAPVLDEAGEVALLVHRAERVTDYYLRRQQQIHDRALGTEAAGPWDDAEADLWARGDELRRALEREQVAAQRLARLADVSVRLSSATSIAELIDVVIHRGLAVLGAEGGAVATAARTGDPSSGWDLVLTGSLGTEAEAIFSHIPSDSTLPVAAAARTGTTILLADREQSLAFSADMADALRTTGLSTWLSVPLLTGSRVLGAITAGWREPRVFDEREMDVVRALVAQCAQTLQRLQARDTERRAADLQRRATDLARAAAQQQATLVAITQALADAITREDVLAVLSGWGTTLLGANGCGLCLHEPDGTHVTSLVTDTYEGARATAQRVPAGFPLPAIRSAATGESFFLGDRDQTEQAFPGSEPVYVEAGVQASAAVPLHGRGQLMGCLSVGFAQPRVWSTEQKEMVRAFAALTAQALDRIAAHEAEQTASAAAAGIAETLQRSMLTDPPEPDHLQITVRYAASAAHAEVGGDWYDAFITAGGLTSLVIGDVTGHDMAAAAVMGQLRNLVRGIAFTLGEPPAKVLGAVDRAAAGLGIDTVATAIVAQVEQDEAHRAAGTRLLRWSNAGHLPPLLIGADGFTRFLDAESDLVLGWDPSVERHDHEVVLEPGTAVLLYTDGLVERRRVGVQAGLDWLADAVSELVAQQLSLEELCDALLAQVGDHLDDDVALLALRAHPEDDPRPAEAGPEHVPAGLDAAIEAAPDDGGL